MGKKKNKKSYACNICEQTHPYDISSVDAILQSTGIGNMLLSDILIKEKKDE